MYSWRVRKKGYWQRCKKYPVWRTLFCTLKEQIGASDLRRGHTAVGLLELWMASLFVGSRYARKADCEFGDHTRLIIRAASGWKPGGVERREGLCRAGQRGMSVGRGWCGSNDRASREARKEPHVYRGRFSRTIVRSATLAHCRRAATRGRGPLLCSWASEKRHLRTSPVSTWRYRVEHTELLTRAPPPSPNCPPGRYRRSRDAITALRC